MVAKVREFPVDRRHRHTDASRYLFLDIDGVLHTHRPPFDLRHAASLLPIAEEFALKVVISSSWREAVPMQDLQRVMGALGAHVVGMTPVLSKDELATFVGGCKGRREAEIWLWLERHAHRRAHWVAVDDERTLFFDNCSRLFLTNADRGLDAHAAQDLRQFIATQGVTGWR